jgi:hypothetical protein
LNLPLLIQLVEGGHYLVSRRHFTLTNEENQQHTTLVKDNPRNIHAMFGLKSLHVVPEKNLKHLSR